MKTSLFVISTGLLIGSGLAFAGAGGMNQSMNHSGNDTGQAMAHPGMSGCGMSMQQASDLQQQMGAMRSQMSEIMHTADASKRQALMEDQMDQMDRMLQEMKNMHADHSMMSQDSMMHGNNSMHGSSGN